MNTKKNSVNSLSEEHYLSRGTVQKANTILIDVILKNS